MMENNQQTNDVNTPQNNQSNKGIVVLLVIIILLLLGVGGFFAYKYFTNNQDTPNKPNEQEKQDDNNKQENDKQDENEKEEQEEPKGEYDTVIYLYDDVNQVCGFKKDDGCSKQLATIKTETKNPTYLVDASYAKYLLYEDNGIKLYDSTKKKITKINGEYVIDSTYSIILNENETIAMGIGYKDKNGYAVYYNLSTNKKMYENKYKADEYVGFAGVNNDTVSLTANSKGYLLSNKEEKELLKDESSRYEYPRYVGYGSNGDYFYILENCGGGSCDPVKAYSNAYKLITEAKEGLLIYSVYNKTLYVLETNKIAKYNPNGEKIFTSGEYSKVEQIIRNYVVYVKENNYILENIEDTTESKLITEFPENKGYYDHFTSGYWTREALDLIDEKDKKEGAYLVFVYFVQDKTTGYYGMEYCYTPSKEIVTYPIKEEVGGRAKPVLYLYPEKDTNVKVTFEHPEYLTTTYPKYKDSWKVLAKPNGDLYDNDGKYYYALYWDEVRYNEVSFNEGFYVESKDAIKFLEEKLTIIGLNDKEKNEFIMYWLPILEKNGKNLVYFELTKEREASNKLNITPTPDSLLRVSIHIKKVNSKVNIKEQKLETFKRVGFTAVEWGGMTY